MNKQSIDYTNQDFFLGIDVHKKSWKVTVRTNGSRGGKRVEGNGWVGY